MIILDGMRVWWKLLVASALVVAAACSEPAAPAAAPMSASSGDEQEVAGETRAIEPVAASEPGAGPDAAPPTTPPNGSVFLNGVELSAPDLAELGAIFNAAPEPGHYWYDGHSGLWGLDGHGPCGVTKPELRTPAALVPDAAQGHTLAYVNDRLLTETELTAVATLLGWELPVTGRYPGRYVLGADGALYSAQGRYLGNVAAAARRMAAGTPPAATKCIWFHLYEGTAPLGRDVNVSCD